MAGSNNESPNSGSNEFPWTAFIYSGGWRGAASRACIEPGRSLYFDRPIEPRAAARLAASLSDAPDGLRVYFFGDLDYSGMGILKTMRQTYPQLEAWPAGYAALLLELEHGRCHRPAQAEKDRQVNPGVTGSAWADRILLPAVADAGTFVDQEAWFPSAEGAEHATLAVYTKLFGRTPGPALGVTSSLMVGHLSRAIETGDPEFDPHDYLPPGALA